MKKNPKKEKDDFFDYDNYIDNQKSHVIQNDKGINKSSVKSTGKNRQKPAKLVKATAEDVEKARHSSERIKTEGHESIENIKRMFDAALDEDIKELTEFSQEEITPAFPVSSPKGMKRKFYLIFGVIVTMLSIIGLIAAVDFTSDRIRAFADNTKQKNEFASFIYPIVICDPPPFNQTIKLRNDTIITAAVWDIILYDDKTKYTAEFDYIVVPEVDIEFHAEKLFGKGLAISHGSILGADLQFYYDEEIKSYRIPSNPKYFAYSPVIEDITRVGERYTLTVGYISPTPAWLTFNTDEVPEPVKYVEYVVSKRNNEYSLVAIQDSPLIGAGNSQL